MKNTFANKVYLLAIIAILLPLFIGQVILGVLLNSQFQDESQERMNANLEIFNLMLNNEFSNLIKGVKGLSTDNTIIQTLMLDIKPQLIRHLTTKKKVFNFSDLIISDSTKNVIHNINGKIKIDDDLLKGYINNSMLQILSNDSLAKICYTRKILHDQKIIGYVTGTINIIGKSNIDKFNKKIIEPFGIWFNDKLIITNFDTINTVPDFNQFKKEGDIYKYKNLLLKTKYMKLRPDIFRYGVILSLTDGKIKILKYVLQIFFSTLFIFSIILLLLSKYMKNLIQPVNQLTSMAESIEKGEEMPEIPEFYTDEFDRMSIAFKNMIWKLKQSESSLRLHSNQLQDLVDERTKELKLINNELRQVITEQSNTALELKSQKNNFAMLSETALELLEFPYTENIYDFICEKLYKYLGKGIISLSSVDNKNDSFTVESIIGIGDKNLV